MGRFEFKRFAIDDRGCGMKIGTDSVLLGAWADLSGARSILDLGCGSGVLALMAAQRAPEARITGVEIDADACLCARANADASPWGIRIEIAQADANEFEPSAAFDMIISNPPYFTNGEKAPDAQRAQARHAEGLSPTAVLQLASRWLSPDGQVALVAPAECRSDLIYSAEMLRLKLRRECMVATVEGKQPTRGLWQFARIDGACDASTLAIRTADGAFTAEYTTLTKDFYLKF